MIGTNTLKFNDATMNKIVEHYLKTVMLRPEVADDIYVNSVTWDDGEGEFVVEVVKSAVPMKR